LHLHVHSTVKNHRQSVMQAIQLQVMSISPALLAGRYRLRDPLGSGGMGRVWLARDEVLHRDVAIKEVNLPNDLTWAERQELRTRTLREARTAGRLSHPNVVQVYDVLGIDDRPWIVMEYVGSRSLQQIIEEDGPVPPGRAAEIGLAVLAALTAAHRAGVLHRDVKPGNVLIADSGRVVLTDFGLATFEGSEGSVTRPGLVWGSPEYVAPERAKYGISSVEADLWSLGATLFAAVEGRSPYARSTAMGSLTALATEKPPTPQRAGAVKPVITGLLRKDPRARLRPAQVERMLRRLTEPDERPRPMRRLPRQRAAPGAPRPGAPAHPAEPDAPQPDAPQPGPPQPGPPQPGPPQPGAPAPGAPAGAVPTGPAPGPSGGHPLPEPAFWLPARSTRDSAPPGPPSGVAPNGGSPILAAEPQLGRRSWVFAILAVLLVAAVGGYAVYRASDPDRARHSPAPSQPPATRPSPPTVAPGNALPGDNSLPPGWGYHDQPGQFRVAAPVGWVIHNEAGEVRFQEPGTVRRLAIEVLAAPVRVPREAVLNREIVWAAGGGPRNYQRLRLADVAIGDGGVEWDYQYDDPTFGRTRVICRWFRAQDRAYAISWTTPLYDFGNSRGFYDLALASFRTR